MKKTLVYGLAVLGALSIPLYLVSAFSRPEVETVYVDRPVIEKQYVNLNVVLHGFSINAVVIAAHRNPVEYAKIVAFYTQITRNQEITEIILDGALRHGVPVNIAFAMAEQESGFDPASKSYNADSGTWDRGLFQLNSASHPSWRIRDFFDPRKSTEEAMSIFAEDIPKDSSIPTEIALIRYNAGRASIPHKRIPYITTFHVIRVKSYEQGFDRDFCKNLVPTLQLTDIDIYRLD